MTGLSLIAAATLFWLTWVLMPGVGIVDSDRIFALVAEQREMVLIAVVLQLLSAALYAPAMVGMTSDSELRQVRAVRWGAGLLLVGAMGSAADGVIHLLAYAMTAPNLDHDTLVRVMAFMQGPGLVLVAPLLLPFFAGGVVLSLALANLGMVPRWSVRLHPLALAAAVVGLACAAAQLAVPARIGGLAALGLVSAAQAWAGYALWRRGASATRAGADAAVRPRRMSARTAVGLIAVLVLGQAFVPRASAAPAEGSGAGSAAGDPGWPRAYTTPDGGRVQMHQPQIASWENQTHLVAWVAVSVQPKGAAKPMLGTIKVEADTTVALEQRLVSFAAFRITETNFGSVGRDQIRALVEAIERTVPQPERVIALDRVLAGLDKSRILAKNVDGVKADPPVVFVSTKPAVLVNLDGQPIWSPIPGADLRYAVNTNWDLFEHTPSKALFLRHFGVWLTAPRIAGPWTAAGTLPASFARLPADENWKEVRENLPGRPVSARDLPTVFVSTSPAELILLRGEPSYLLVSGAGGLLWVSNTDSDVFRLGKTGRVYYLVAGRWFSAPDFGGPWTFATPVLPAELQRIGIEHPRSRVLASIPGTSQAAEAVLLAQVPQTARVGRKEVTAPAVAYHGEPRFESIDKTTVLRAINTDKDIVSIGGAYYLCFQGVWFVSRTPQGPWDVAGSIPAAIYAIPASSPAHHITYVTIVDTTPDWVTFSTAAGYSGVTVAWGCVVWGTGWYYPPYVSYGSAYPVYYPYYPTYGYSAWYNPWVGSYERGAVAYGPYGGVGAAARYNPSTGTYARGAVAWGPYGANGAAQAYNPRTGTYAQTRQGSGVYGSWGSSYVQRGDDWAQTARVTNNVTGATSRVTRTDDGAMVSRNGPNGGGFVAAGEEGVYAGRDGNVYRRADGGGWQKYEDGTWGATRKPRDTTSTIGQLERDRSARAEGAQRARDRGTARNGTRPNPRSYADAGGRRPSGGGRRR
jgi:hypothetical protein